MKKLFYIFCITLIVSCSDDESTNTGTLVFEFDTRAGLEDDFAAGVTYENELGQEFQLTTFEYTITNVRLKHEDGSFVDDPAHAEYHIDGTEEEETLVTLKNIPAGTYTGVEFTLGGNEVYVKITGTSPESAEAGNEIHYEVSGLSNQKIKTIEFHDHTANVNHNSEPEVHLIVDVLKFFTGSTDIDFSEVPVCTEEECAVDVAANYAETFVFDHIHS